MLDVILTVVGALASLIAIVGLFFSPRFRNTVSKWLPKISGVRYTNPWSMDDINAAIATCSKHVAIMQTWIPTLNADVGKWRELGRGVSCRILLASDPIVAARLAYRPHAVPLTDQNLKILSRFNSEHDAKFEIRKYRGLPFGPVYIIDDVVYWGIYLAGRDSMMGPRFTCSRLSGVGKMISESFEAVWNGEDTLVVEGTGVPEKERAMEPVNQPPLSDLEIGVAEHGPDGYQRNCSVCNTWLSYRTVGSGSDIVVESYCPNRKCPRFNQKVENLHVS